VRVAVVAYYFPPLGGGGVNRTLKAVRAMAEAGLRPWVLTVDDAAWVRDPALLAEVPPGARVLRLPNPDWGRIARVPRATRAAGGAAGPRGRTAGRRPGRLRRVLVPDLHVGWSALAAGAVAGWAAARAVDAVWTTLPPYSAAAAGLAARALGVPWVCDFRDAWTDCPTRLDLPPWRARLERGLEDAVLRRADRVLFASDAARERAVRRHPDLAARSETVLTGFDPGDFAGTEGVAPPAHRLELVHAGSVATNQLGPTLERLLDALVAWERAEPGALAAVRVRLLGAEPEVAERVARRDLAGVVRVEPAVSRRALPARLRGAHACLVLAAPVPLGDEPVPGKLFDAVGAGRPLLALAWEGPLARLVREAGLGAAVDPRDEKALVDALRGLRERARAGRALPGPSEAARERFSNARARERIRAALRAATEGAACR